MLEVFKRGGSVQSLVDSKDRERFLRHVAALEPYRALEELARKLSMIAGDEVLRADAKAAIVFSLDLEGARPAQQLCREYLSSARLAKSQESRLWETIHDFFASVARAYLNCFDKVAPNVRVATENKIHSARFSVLALRALGRQLKLEHMRYGPVDRDIWWNIGRVYGRVEAARIARLAVQESPGISVQTTPEVEFVRIAMFAVCSLGSLLPLQIEIADRLIGRFASSFKISRRRGSATPYLVDLEQGSPPARFVGSAAEDYSARYFGAGAAYQELLALKQQIALLDEVPDDLAPGVPVHASRIIEVIDHLAQYWVPRVVGRRHPRHGIKSRVTVAWGLDGVLDALDPLASRPFEKRAMESWIIDNASAGGVGATVTAIAGEWLRVGCLVAMQPEGGKSWILGVVKRLRRNDDSGANVGIQTLARLPTPVEFRIQVGNATALRAVAGILLDPGYTEAEVPVLLRTRTSEPGRTFVLEREGRHTQLIPMMVTARGPDYEVVRCRKLVRSEG